MEKLSTKSMARAIIMEWKHKTRIHEKTHRQEIMHQSLACGAPSALVDLQQGVDQVNSLKGRKQMDDGVQHKINLKALLEHVLSVCYPPIFAQHKTNTTTHLQQEQISKSAAPASYLPHP